MDSILLYSGPRTVRLPRRSAADTGHLADVYKRQVESLVTKIHHVYSQFASVSIRKSLFYRIRFFELILPNTREIKHIQQIKTRRLRNLIQDFGDCLLYTSIRHKEQCNLVARPMP